MAELGNTPYLSQVIAAEGEQKASLALRQAAEVMAESPASLQVRMVKVLRLLEGLFYVTFCSCALRRWNWELGIVMLALSVFLTTYLRLC